MPLDNVSSAALNYQPPPTVERFMLSESRVRCLAGPVGSGKSMGCIVEILRRSRLQRPFNGVRSTRWAVVRNTMQQLRTTVLTDIQQYLRPMISYFVTDSTIRLRAPMPDGTRIEADIMLIPLDTKEDQRRLLSMQLTGAWVNELREVPLDIIAPLLGRLGRYPSKLNGGPTWYGLIADSNPWDTDSPYHEKFVLTPTPGWELFHQPSGIGPQAENRDNLPAAYYDDLMNGRDPEWAAVHVESQWGTSNAGQAVFRRSFHAPTHARDMQVVVNPHRPLMVAFDFGRTPTALITQVDALGRLLVFEEICTEDMGLIQMCEEKLRPRLLADPYAGKRAFIVADPAGNQKSQVTEETPIEALKQLGFQAFPAATNSIEPRLTAVEKLLRGQIQGEPSLQINRNLCPILIKALGDRYRYKKKRDGKLEDIPEKLHPWSDVADCLSYAALGVSTNITGRVLMRDQRRAMPAPPSRGWT